MTYTHRDRKRGEETTKKKTVDTICHGNKIEKKFNGQQVPVLWGGS